MCCCVVMSSCCRAIVLLWSRVVVMLCWCVGVLSCWCVDVLPSCRVVALVCCCVVVYLSFFLESIVVLAHPDERWRARQLRDRRERACSEDVEERPLVQRSRRRRGDAACCRLDDAARRTALASRLIEQLPYGIVAELYLKGVDEVAFFSVHGTSSSYSSSAGGGSKKTKGGASPRAAARRLGRLLWKRPEHRRAGRYTRCAPRLGRFPGGERARRGTWSIASRRLGCFGGKDRRRSCRGGVCMEVR